MDKTRYINLEYLNDMSGGDRGVIIEMAEIFISDVPAMVSRIKEHHYTKNWESLGKIAHKARSSAMIMGMEELAGNLKNLELLTMEDDQPEIGSALILSIETQFNSAIEELKIVSRNL